MNRDDLGFESRPSEIPAADDCFFYHTTELPGHGLVQGQWDLRQGLESYLGRLAFDGKNVLEIGPASGFLTVQMERLGAAVTSCELPSFDQWDLVPYAGSDLEPAYVEDRVELGRRLRNAYWLTHAAFDSRARLVECPVYEVPAELGPFEVALFGMVLVHVRDPFLALQNALRGVTETVIVTDILPGWDLSADAIAGIEAEATRPARGSRLDGALADLLAAEVARIPPRMHFCPRFAAGEPKETWWQLNPSVLREFLGVLGFPDQTVSFHCQTYDPKYRWADPDEAQGPARSVCYTIVAHRNSGAFGIPQSSSTSARSNSSSV